MDSGDGFVWWKIIPMNIFLYLVCLGYILYHGTYNFLSVFLIFVILFDSYTTYMSIEEIYVKYMGGNKEGKLRYEGLRKFYLTKRVGHIFNEYKVNYSTENKIDRCIYFYFTICFSLVFVLPNRRGYIPLRLFLLFIFTTLIWYRTGAGVPKTWRQSLKRFGVGVAGVLSGLVIALVLRWLFAQVL